MDRFVIATLVAAAFLAGCSSAGPTATASQAATASPAATPTAQASPSAPAAAFPTAVFAGLGEEPVSGELATDLQAVLEMSASGDGLTAAVISPEGDLEWRNRLRRRMSGNEPGRSDVHRQHHQDPCGGPGDAAG